MPSDLTPIDYYDVFELALSALTAARGEYRRHFGAHVIPSPAGYCWFKGVTAPERHPDYAKWLCDAGTELESRLLAEMVRKQPRSLIDVGCGNGALLRRIAREYPAVALTGVNFQPKQVATARQLLAGSSATVLEADFLREPCGQGFDVAVLFESAFHMPDKAALVERLADALAPGGEAWLIDIVIAERASATFQNMGSASLFTFASRQVWQSTFAQFGFEEIEFEDFSRGAAEVLQVSDVKLLATDYFAPRFHSAIGAGPERATEVDRAVTIMTQIAVEYRRLSRLMRGGMLEYALMRYRKRG